MIFVHMILTTLLLPIMISFTDSRTGCYRADYDVYVYSGVMSCSADRLRPRVGLCLDWCYVVIGPSDNL